METKTAQKVRKKGSKMLWLELKKLAIQIELLAKKQALEMPLQQLANQAIEVATSETIQAAIIFLTPKQKTSEITKVLQWLGLDEDIEDELVFGGTMKGDIPLDTDTKLHMQMMHFDTYPMHRNLLEFIPVKIVVYDCSYAANYPQWELAWSLLEAEPAIHLCIDVSTQETSIQMPSLNSIWSQKIRNQELTSLVSLQEWMFTTEVQTHCAIAQLKSMEYLMQQLYQLIDEDVSTKEKVCKGKQLLAQKKQFAFKDQETRISSKAVSVLKVVVDAHFKKMIQEINEGIVEFEKGNEDFVAVEKEITAFKGFVEQKANKQLTLKITEGAIQHKTGKATIAVATYFERCITQINTQLAHVQSDISIKFEKWNISQEKPIVDSISSSLGKEIIETTPSIPEKPYEKQISYKGIGALLMELRTPLFMLMPFMMIFGLFGALVGSEDKGNIMTTTLFYQDRPCIAIDKLPESRNNAFRKFIAEVDALRNPKKGIFDKEINDALTTEPQLAVIKVKVSGPGKKVKTIEKLDYTFDAKAEILYVYLTPNADRNDVIEKLFDPTYKLLTIPSTTRRSMGISGLIRMMSGLSEYKYLIMIGLIGLIVWFITSRKQSMDQSLVTSKAREQNKLNTDLKQFVDKVKKQRLMKWKSAIGEQIIIVHKMTIQRIEKNVALEINVNKQEQLNTNKLIQKEITEVKTEKSKWNSIYKEHRKIGVKLQQFKSKIKYLQTH